MAVAFKFEDAPKRKRRYNPKRPNVTPKGKWITTQITNTIKNLGGIVKDFGAMIHDIKPGSIPTDKKLHIHKEQDTIFLVLMGRIVINVEGTEYELGPKSFIWIPRGLRHEFTKVIDHVQILAIVSNPEHTKDIIPSKQPWYEEFPDPKPRKKY
ncbi:cupin domain-containing protein [Candidatus Bathyarchaeota archaeon]|nr:cupin domain-containing protein [Candidatus Bathyarchaeota archaeon]